mmetsp:Transcript_26713/g.48414  ORF Transcript_26713/g.48414 Transcript_26713/m.48414 type:complete len:204 (-) Transcript_26713:1179-1790(-)
MDHGLLRQIIPGVHAQRAILQRAPGGAGAGHQVRHEPRLVRRQRQPPGGGAPFRLGPKNMHRHLPPGGVRQRPRFDLCGRRRIQDAARRGARRALLAPRGGQRGRSRREVAPAAVRRVRRGRRVGRGHVRDERRRQFREGGRSEVVQVGQQRRGVGVHGRRALSQTSAAGSDARARYLSRIRFVRTVVRWGAGWILEDGDVRA